MYFIRSGGGLVLELVFCIECYDGMVVKYLASGFTRAFRSVIEGSGKARTTEQKVEGGGRTANLIRGALP